MEHTRSCLTGIDVLGLHKIREILLHMLFQINVSVQNVLNMKKRVQAKQQEVSENRKGK